MERVTVMELMVSGLSTLIVGLMVAGIVFLAVRSIVKDRKNGKSLCGGNCGGCSCSGMCHPKREGQKNQIQN
jgi:hypothetical protein